MPWYSHDGLKPETQLSLDTWRLSCADKKAELHAARLDPGAMALLTDERGFITEGTGNNYFIVKDGEYASNPVVLHTLFMLPPATSTWIQCDPMFSHLT